MSLHIIKSDHRKKEKIVSRYLHEIREIAKAGLSRLGLFRTGLTARSSRLLAMRGDAMSQVNPVPRAYARGFGALALRGLRNIHPRAYAQGVLWYGVNKLAHALHAWISKSLSTNVAKLILSNETTNMDVSSFSEWRRGHRKAGASALIVAALCLSIAVAFAFEIIQIGPGPVPGFKAEEIPEAQANVEMAAEGNRLSNNQINTPDPERAQQFAFETSAANETFEVADENINQENFQDTPLPIGVIDVPTNAAPSPLCFKGVCAQPFTQQMLRFEEFGPVPLKQPTGDPADGLPPVTLGPEGRFPPPVDAQSGPAELKLDAFLKQYITVGEAAPFPYPTRRANDPDRPPDELGSTPLGNPWQGDIEGFLGRDLFTPPAEGRPPGEDWAHQRWQEFFPEVYFNTAQAGARTNRGLRDPLQFHQYSVGEFAPGGLYHNTAGLPATAGCPATTTEGTTCGIPLQFHPLFPVQDPLALWTWDGTFPPKLLMTRYGESVLMRHYNALPIDPAANMGFGLHTITTHEHNGHNPAESDGYTQAFFFPGQFYDYHWVMVGAGWDTFPASLKAGTPTGGPRADAAPDLGIRPLRGDWREIMSTHWFHDHMLDFTAPNVYKGNAAMFNMYSAVDRGHEGLEDGVNLRFPSGTALNWGNRDYDVNLMIAEKAWDADGQLFFNPFNLDGWLGDQILTNWLWKPYLDVRARRYRFRILNGAVSRYFRFALVEQVSGTGGELSGPPGSGISYNRVPFHMIANDGNIMEHAVFFDGNTTVGGLTNRKGILPTQAIAERYDIVVDFAQFAPGTKLHMVNLLEHHNGRRPHEEIPLEDVLDGSYAPLIENGRNINDPTVTAFLEFRVQACTKADGSPAASCAEGGEAVAEQQDGSMNPADFVAGKKKMIPLPGFTQEELDDAIHRTFEFKRSSGTDTAPWTIKTDGGAGFTMDPRRLSASPTRARVEIWHLTLDLEGAGEPGGGGGWSHPIHVHFEEGQILKRGGVAPPEWEQWARKDIYRIGRMDDSSIDVDFAIRFREFLGTFMEHCHNTQHEDHAMLLRWDVENPGQVRVMPTPMPSWDGVGYVPSYALPTFRTGDGVGFSPPVNTPPSVGITAPADGASFTEGDLISFTGSANDAEDGGLTASLAWTSSLDGAIGSGGSFSSTLSEGTHTITAASVPDSGGLTGSASITVTVNAAAGACTPSDFILWDGTTDTAIEPPLCADGSSVVPSVPGLNIEAVLPSGPVTLVLSGPTPITRTEKVAPFMLGGDKGGNIFELPALAPGAYTLTATAGTAGTPSTIVFTVETGAPGNTPPSVGITAPADGASFTEGDLISFTGSANDAEDGGLTAKLAWTSSLDGAIGSGGSFSSTLSEGTHTITTSVMDSGGLTGSASITVTVNAAAGACTPSDFILWDGTTDTVIEPLCADGSSVVPSVPGLNIEAVLPSGPVTLVLSGPTPITRTEKVAPFMLGGDDKGVNIFELPALAPGAYTLTATAAGTSLTINFMVQ